MQAQPSFSIVMADDDIEDLEMIEEAILHARPGAELHIFPNGKQALNYLENCAEHNLPCLTILDYNMPEMNGSEVIRELCGNEKYKGMPIVILSTSNADHHIKECLNNGAANYFVKPTSMKELNAVVEKMLSYCGEKQK